MKKPKFPKKINADTIRKYKSDLRKWDRWRIINGISTPSEIQKENSLVPTNVKIEVVKFPYL